MIHASIMNYYGRVLTVHNIIIQNDCFLETSVRFVDRDIMRNLHIRTNSITCNTRLYYTYYKTSYLQMRLYMKRFVKRLPFKREKNAFHHKTNTFLSSFNMTNIKFNDVHSARRRKMSAVTNRLRNVSEIVLYYRTS